MKAEILYFETRRLIRQREMCHVKDSARVCVFFLHISVLTVHVRSHSKRVCVSVVKREQQIAEEKAAEELSWRARDRELTSGDNQRKTELNSVSLAGATCWAEPALASSRSRRLSSEPLCAV